MEYNAEHKKETIKKVIIIVLVGAYMLFPDFMPGPADDIIVLLLGMSRIAKQS